MIIVHGTIPVLPDCRERALELARRMIEATRTETDALMGHFQTEHMEEFLRELPKVVSGEIITRRYSVQSVDEEIEESSEAPPIVH